MELCRKYAYWKAVLNEVLNKDNPDHPKLYTNLKSCDKKMRNQQAQARRQRRLRQQREEAKGVDKVPYYPIDFYDGITLVSERELAVVEMLMQEYTNTEMAKELSVSQRTIEYHVKNLRKKFQCETKKSLVEFLQHLECKYI